MKNDIAIVTVPSGPRSETSYGFLTLNALAYMLGQKLNAKTYLYLNKMHTYKDRGPATQLLLSDLSALDIKFDEVILDENMLTPFSQDFKYFVDKGFIHEKTTNKIKCNCGKIDCADAADIQYKYILKQGDDLSCSFCGNKCYKSAEKALFFRMPDFQDLSPMQIIPTKFQNKAQEFQQTFGNQEIMISKERNTGITENVQGAEFNIDIDFNLYNYLTNIPQRKRIIVGTTHVIYQMLMMDTYDKLKTDKTDNIFVAMPYVAGKCELSPDLQIENYKKQLYMLGSLTKNSDCQFNKSLFQLITKDRKENYLRALYSSMMAPYKMNPDMSFFQNVNNMYMNDFNMNNLAKKAQAKLAQAKTERHNQFQK